MLMSIPNLPSLTSEAPLNNNQPPATQTTQATQTRSREEEMAAQYYAKRVEETPRPMVLPALAAAIAPTQQQDGRYRSPYASTEPQRQPNVLAPMPMAPMAPMSMSHDNTPEPLPPRHMITSRTSSESQTDEHHEPPKAITIPGNNQYTPGVHRVSHPGTPQPTGPSDGTKPAKPRPHVCLICQRTFARREHLNRHELSHTKEKPFECNECSRCFSRRDLLLRHKQKLHITNPYVRPRDRAKMGDGQDDGDERPMQPMAPMRSENDGINVPIAVHQSGQIQQGLDGGSGHHDGERGGPSHMVMAHMRPALPLPHAPQQQPKAQPAGSAASLYYQKQDIDISQLDLSRFRSFSRSPRPPTVNPRGPPQGAPPIGYPPGGTAPSPGQTRALQQGAPLPVSPHQLHREAPRYVGGPTPAPINHDAEESGFHIPFAKRPRRDTDGRSRNNQSRGEPGVPGPPAYDLRHGQVPVHARSGPPNGRYESPHTLLDQLAIAAVPDSSRSHQQHPDYDPQGQPPLSQDISMAQAPQNEDHEVNIWRSPGGTHRVVQFERPIPPIITAKEALAPPKQQRSPSRKRSLQTEDDTEGEEGMKMQGGFRRSMRRALSMSMEDGLRPVIHSAPASPKESKEARGKGKGKKVATPEKASSKPNVRYIKAASSRSSLKETEKEKQATSPVRGRKPSAKAKANEVKEEEVTPEKRGRGRPPKSASKATPASAGAKAKKTARPVKFESEDDDDDDDEESEDEQAAVEEQLLQEEKRTTRRGREVKETKKVKEQREEEKLETGRTFRSVRLQAKHMK